MSLWLGWFKSESSLSVVPPWLVYTFSIFPKKEVFFSHFILNCFCVVVQWNVTLVTHYNCLQVLHFYHTYTSHAAVTRHSLPYTGANSTAATPLLHTVACARRQRSNVTPWYQMAKRVHAAQMNAWCEQSWHAAAARTCAFMLASTSAQGGHFIHFMNSLF